MFLTGVRPVRRLLAAAALALAFGSLPAPAPAAGPPHAPHAPDAILVKMRAGASGAESAAAIRSVRAARGRRYRSGAELWRLAPGVGVERAIAALRADPAVEYAEPDYIVTIDAVPDDPSYPNLWGLSNSGQTGGTPGADIEAEGAWEITTGSRTVLVGVVDSGIDYNHPDLAANIWTNPGEIAGNGADDDGNGFADDVHGWDFRDDDNDPFDENRHGTHVAGTIGASGNNALGVTGVAWQVTLVPLRFLDASGSGRTSDAVAAIEYATALGVDILNNSWGGGAYSQALRDAIGAAAAAEILFVAAAGNNGSNNDFFPAYPASYDAPNILAVASTDHNDEKAPNSNYGPLSVHLGAPGLSIYSTLPGASYGYLSGTSMATPHVTGVAALVLSVAPIPLVETLKRTILDSVEPLPSLAGLVASGGRVNARAAVGIPDGAPPSAIADLAAPAPGSNTVLLTWTAPGDDGTAGTAFAYDLRVSTSPIPDEAAFALAPRVPGLPAPSPSGTPESFEVGGLLPDTGYFAAARAIDEWGLAGPLGNVVAFRSLESPVLESSPPSFAVSLLSGQQATRALALRNAGPGTLDWAIPGAGGALPSWIAASPASGRLRSGERIDVALGISARGLSGGLYSGAVAIASNDPAAAVVLHPVTLEVGDAPALEATPAAIDFGTIPSGFAAQRYATVSNIGTRPLTLAASAADPALTVEPAAAVVDPGGSVLLRLVWSPAAPGPLAAAYTIASDASNAPLVALPAAGSATAEVPLEVSPAALAGSLVSGQTGTRTVRLVNRSASDVAINLTAELERVAAAGLSTGWAGALPAAAALPPSGIAPTREFQAAAGLVYPPPALPLEGPDPSDLPQAPPAGAPAAAPAATAIAPPAFVNGGFETGDFSGWTATTNGLPVLQPWTVSTRGGGWFRNSVPVEGRFSALSGFDGEAGLEMTLSQDLVIPPGLLRGAVTWVDRIQFDSNGLPSSLPRIYEASFQDLDGNLLATLFRQEILLDGQPYTDLGWRRRIGDLAPYAGMTIRLSIRLIVPESFTGPAQIELDAFEIGAEVLPRWLLVSPRSALLPPGGSLDATVTLDAGASGTAVYEGAIRLDTDIPGTPALRVPALLSVTGLPDIHLSGETASIQSGADYQLSGATTRHTFPISLAPAGGATVTVTGDGDFGALGEAFTVLAEGLNLGFAGATGVDCIPLTRSFPIAAADFAGMTADGVVRIDIRNSTYVDPICGINRHTVRLSYQRPVDRLDFGGVFAGAAAARAFVVENRGTDPLRVASIAASDPAFSAAPASFEVPPGGSLPVEVTFAPSGLGAAAGTLTIASNDPDTPAATVLLEGTGLDPPSIAADPNALAASLASGTALAGSLTLANGGGSPLEWSATVRSLPSTPSAAGACDPTRAVAADWSTGELLAIYLDTGTHQRIVDGLANPNKGLVLDPTRRYAYVVESGGGSIAKVDIAAKSFTRIASGLAFPNGLALDPTGTKAWVTQSTTGELSALDLATGTTTPVASGFGTPNQVVVSASGRRAWLTEYRAGRLSEVDLVTGDARPVASGLEGASGLAIDPGETTAYVTEAASGEISAVDLATGAVRLVADDVGNLNSIVLDAAGTRAFVSSFNTGEIWEVDLSTGAIAVRASNMANPTGIALFLPAGCTGSFVALDPIRGTVPPFSSAPVAVTLDATRLNAGRYAAEIEISSNDPALPRLAIPAALEVSGEPRISVSGEIVRLESVRPYRGSGARTAHVLRLVPPPAGGGILDIVAEGDYGFAGETTTIFLEGTAFGAIGAIGADCAAAVGRIELTETGLGGFGSDGLLQVELVNSPIVDDFCPLNRHTVRLTYLSATTEIDFGTLFTGTRATRTLVVANQGTDLLSVTGITASDPTFSATPASFQIPPGLSQTVAIAFEPPSPGAWAADLVIRSDDPIEPEIRLTLRGAAIDPPAMTVAPASLAASLLSGAETTIPLRLGNAGGSPLEASLAVEYLLGDAAPAPPVAPREDDPGAPATLSEPGDFEVRSPSLAPLSGVTEDPASGAIYALAFGSTAFYRHDAGDDRWHSLAPAPVAGTEGGGTAFLGGRVYAAWPSEDASLGAYDAAAGAWSLLPHPIGRGTANVASDGIRYLYLAEGFSFVRLDPITGETLALASPPFAFGKRGGLRHIGGVVYGHRGGGTRDFAAWDVATGRWRRLPSLPGGAVGGAAVDPTGREYFAYGSFSGTNLYRYAIDTGVWRAATLPFFAVDDGGLAWLPLPVPALYVAQGAQGNGFARLVTAPEFLRVPAGPFQVAAGDEISIGIVFDGSRIPPGEWSARIVVTGDDPATPEAGIPVTLTVTGSPDVRITGALASVESALDFAVAGAVTSHSLPIAVAPGSDAALELIAEGDFDGAFESASVSMEGILLGKVGQTGIPCAPAPGAFPVAAPLLAAAAADGIVQVEVANTFDVEPVCGVSRHTVRLSWRGAPGSIDFGTPFAGATVSRLFAVENHGTDPLTVASIDVAGAGVSVSPAAFVVAPAASRAVEVLWHAAAAGPLAATLTVRSDDPDEPSIDVALTGLALLAPVAQVSPSSIRAEIHEGGVETRTVTIANAGGSPLGWSALIVPRGAPFATVAPLSGSVPPGGSQVLDLVLDTAGLPPGEHAAELVLAFDDPATPARTVPISLRVAGTPRLRVSGAEVRFDSALPFAGPGASTIHRLRGLPTPGGAGTVELIAEGDFGESGETASASADGRFLGAVGPGSGECAAVSGGFTIDPATLEFLLSDGQMTIEVRNAAAVDGTCAVSRHAVRLRYRLYPELIEFPAAVAGDASFSSLLVENEGNDLLEIHAIETDLPEFSASPQAFSLPPGASREVLLRFAPSAAGRFDGTLLLATNDTGASEIYLGLTGAGLPAIGDLAVTVEPVHVSSTRAWGASGAVTHHRLGIATPPAGGGTLDVILRGDFAAPGKTASVSAEGTLLATLGGGGLPCEPMTIQIPLDAATLASLAADGAVEIEIANAASVGPACPVNDHAVSLAYEPIGDPLRFGDLFPGGARTRSLRLTNAGTGPLSVHSVSSSDPAFAPGAAPAVIPRGGSAVVPILFAPAATGRFAATLSILTDDPDEPSVQVALEGGAVPPPAASVEPGSLSEAVPPQGAVARTIAIRNAGSGDLLWSAEGEVAAEPAQPSIAGAATAAPPLPSWIAVAPSHGRIPAGSEQAVTILLDASALPDGEHLGEARLFTNDPEAASLAVPVRLRSGYLPLARFDIEPATLNPASQGNTIRATLQLRAPLDPRAVRIGSIRLNGIVPPLPSPIRFTDRNGDGVEELVLRFDRRSVLDLISDASGIALTLTGEVPGEAWFSGTDTVRRAPGPKSRRKNAPPAAGTD